MQREILFKAKRIGTDIWEEGWYVFNGIEHGIISNKVKGLWFTINPDTICQYTGILDKNGNKIFEFDDVIGEYGSIYNVGNIYDVIGKWVTNKQWFNQITVIGNIHD